MKQFTLYESFQAIEDEILERSEQENKKSTSIFQKRKRWGMLAACACLAFMAVVTAQRFSKLFGNTEPEPPVSVIKEKVGSQLADVKEEDANLTNENFSDNATENNVSLPDITKKEEQVQKEQLEEEDKILADKGEEQEDSARVQSNNTGINKIITLQEAQAIEPFGAYVLSTAPSGYGVEIVRYFQDESREGIYCIWTKENSLDEIDWKVERYQESDAKRLTSTADTENYDLGLYSIPLADSVPENLWEVVDHPIFDIEELTLDVVKSRAYTINDTGDSNGERMSFGVLYEDILVEVTTKGVSPEWLYEQLISLK